MLWALVFLIVAAVLAALGFGGFDGGSPWIAQVLFLVFVVMFLASLLSAGRTRTEQKGR